MAKEETVIVPLAKSVKRKLEKRADRNGRATGREAARIIEEALK